MKRAISLILAVVLCFGLVACGEVEKNDAGFLVNLAKGLEARWKDSDKVTPDDANYKESLKNLINLELEKLGAYSEYSFADENLSELAKSYFEALNKQLDGTRYYGVDDVLYSQVFLSEGYNQRAKAIYSIYNEYGITVNEDYASVLDDFIAFGEKVIAVENLTQQELVLEHKGGEYEILLENTSKFDLSNMNVLINFLDESGVVVNSWPNVIESWPSGGKSKITVWDDGKDFSQVELKFEDFTNAIVTEFVPVKYVDNMIINITPTNLPAEVNYGYNNKIWTSCIVNDVKFEIGSWYEGKASISVYFSGTKTFDENGETGNATCFFVYKIIGEDGVVVASQTGFVDGLKTNESFSNIQSYIGELVPGNYTIIIEDHMN